MSFPILLFQSSSLPSDSGCVSGKPCQVDGRHLLWGPGSPESVQPTGSTRGFSQRDPTNQSPLNDGPHSTMPVSAPSPPGPGTAGVLSDTPPRASRVCAPAYSGRPSRMVASSLLILLQEKLQAWAPICGRMGCASPWALTTAPVCGRAGCASPWALMLPWLCLVKNPAPVTLEPVPKSRLPLIGLLGPTDHHWPTRCSLS